MKEILITFVHGYEDLNINLADMNRPSLWKCSLEGKGKSYSYPFPRNPEDFYYKHELIKGEMPSRSLPDFEKLPRFGFTGISSYGDHFFAGAWNAVYKIQKHDLKLDSILSNRLMNDMHGIWVDDCGILTILTSKDTIVLTDFDGCIKEFFTIMPDLSVIKDEKLINEDWRFNSKQFRGSAGIWHFNNIQRIGDEIWLTTRSASSFVVVNTKTLKAKMRLMNLPTPVLLHDGLFHNEKFYFTSIDGKIIIAEEGSSLNWNQQEGNQVDFINLFNRDLVAKIIRINETDFGREPNWCRGIAVSEDKIYVSIDGRYDSDLSFGVLEIDEKTQKTRQVARLRWDEVGNEDEIRYVTGFDLILG